MKNVYSVERNFIKVISLWFTVDSTIGVKVYICIIIYIAKNVMMQSIPLVNQRGYRLVSRFKPEFLKLSFFCFHFVVFRTPGRKWHLF